VNEPGAYSWSELMTTDVGGSKVFYNAVFGWDADTQSAGPMEYTEWKIGDRSVGGMLRKPPTMPAQVPPHWGVYFAVSDLDAAMMKVGELGGMTLKGPMDTPAGKLSAVMDSNDAPFNIIPAEPQPRGLSPAVCWVLAAIVMLTMFALERVVDGEIISSRPWGPASLDGSDATVEQSPEAGTAP